MNKHSMILAALLASAATPALAVPVLFEFEGTVRTRLVTDGSGSVFDPSLNGQAFTAQFSFDTDWFTQYTFDPASAQQRFLVTEPPGPSWSGSLTLGGEAIPVQPFDYNRVSAFLADSKGAYSCGPDCTAGHADSFTLQLESMLVDAGNDPVRSTYFFLSGFQIFDPAFPDASDYTMLDFSRGLSTAEIMTTVALPNLSFEYGVVSWTCIDEIEQCLPTTTDTTFFNVTSLTRTIASVPEPGTLGLLAAGLFAAGFTRRQRRRA